VNVVAPMTVVLPATETLMIAEKSRRENPATEIQVNVEVPTIVAPPAMEILGDDPTNVALLVTETLMDEETLILVAPPVMVTLMTAEK